MENESVRLILVGGFLGAGKTTLLGKAAEALSSRGKRVGLITNDQAADLVDTEILRTAGHRVAEVSGGCFCCRFDDLVSASEQLVRDERPDVIVGEPVGSCTDISATVLQPIKRLLSERFRLAPFSVLVDPARLPDLDAAGRHGVLPADVRYIMLKQLEEADVLVLTKIDTLDSERLAACKAQLATIGPPVPVMAVSAHTGEGLDAWLGYVQQPRPAGNRILEIDYQRYAEGEAMLGWLNATVDLGAEGPTDWRGRCRELLDALQAECRDLDAEIAHAKLLLVADGGVVGANTTSSRGEISVYGALPADTRSAVLNLNVRAHMAPQALQRAVEAALDVGIQHGVRSQVKTLTAFSPSAPVPVHRVTSVAE